MTNVFKTAEVAEMLSTSERACSAAQVREMKSRHTDQLIEGQHWFKDGGAVFWTESGFEQLTQIRNPAQCADETPAHCAESADPIDELAAAIAPNYLEQELSHRVPTLARDLARRVLRSHDPAQPGGSALLSLFPVREDLALPLGD